MDPHPITPYIDHLVERVRSGFTKVERGTIIVSDADEAEAALSELLEQLETAERERVLMERVAAVLWKYYLLPLPPEDHLFVCSVMESNPASIVPSESGGEPRPSGEAGSMTPCETDSIPASDPICPTCGERASAGHRNASGECSDAIHSESNACRVGDGWHYFEDGLPTCRCGRLASSPASRPEPPTVLPDPDIDLSTGKQIKGGRHGSSPASSPMSSDSPYVPRASVPPKEPL